MRPGLRSLLLRGTHATWTQLPSPATATRASGPGPAGALPRKSETRGGHREGVQGVPGEQGEPEARGVRGMPGAPWAHWECKACRERPGSGVAGGEEVFRERGPAGVDRASSLGGQAGPGQWGRERARPPEAGPAIAPSLLHGDGFEGLVSSVKKKKYRFLSLLEGSRLSSQGAGPTPPPGPGPSCLPARACWAGRTGRDCVCGCGWRQGRLWSLRRAPRRPSGPRLC